MTRIPVDPELPRVYGLDHSAYRCRDAEETRAFYEDICGFPCTLALHIDRHPTTGEDVNYLHIFFEISREKEGMPENIAFFEVTDRVDDDPALDVWKEKLVEKGVPVEGPIDHGIFRSIYFHDPNGYRLEFCAKDAAAARATAAESAQTRENLRKWNAWKASRMQTAAE